MLKIRPNINLLEFSDHTPTSFGSKFSPNFRKYSSYSKENNNSPDLIHKKSSNLLKISYMNNQERTTAQEESPSKISNSQNIIKKKLYKKCASFKNKKSERTKLMKFLRNNEKAKIPNCKRKSNVESDLKLSVNNIETMIKNNSKDRSDSFGNKITKGNKKNVHISFQNNSKEKKFIEFIPIESFKSFNISEYNQKKIAKPYITRCCAIF